MIDRMLTAHARLGASWLFNRWRNDRFLGHYPVRRWTPNSVHVQVGRDTVALIGGPAPETAAQKLLRRLWLLNPLTASTNFDSQAAGGLVWRNWEADYEATRTAADAQFFTTHDAKQDALWVGQACWIDGTYKLYRCILNFNTASLGAGSNISQVNLTLCVPLHDGSTHDFDVQIVQPSGSGLNPLGVAAYGRILAAPLDKVWRNTAGIVLGTNYASPDLDPDWINPTGTTIYGLRSGYDADDTPPDAFASEIIYPAACTYAVESQRPLLTVAYGETTPPPSSIDSIAGYVVAAAPCGVRPAAGRIGRYWQDAATGNWYQDNGTEWVLQSGGSGGGGSPLGVRPIEGGTGYLGVDTLEFPVGSLSSLGGAVLVRGHYRQYVFINSGGDLGFVVDADGNPVTALMETE